MKKLLYEIILIVMLATILALVYNFSSDRPVALIYHPPKETFVDDSFLSKMLNDKAIDTTNVHKDIPKNNITEKDSTHLTNNNIPVISTENRKINKTTVNDSIPLITYRQLIKSLNNPKIFLIDARRPEDYAKGQIGNSINIFPNEDNNNEEEQKKYFEKLMSVPSDKLIIVYCDGGICELSHKVADDLSRLGYKNILIYKGGWEEWSKLNINK